MDRKEFISSLREYLEGEVPAPIIEKNIRYYESYIADHAKSREEEEQCIAEIGEPRLIATTIITSYQMSGEEGQSNEGYYQEQTAEKQKETDPLRAIPLKYKMIGIVSTIVLLVVLFFILKMFFFVAVRILFPVAVIAMGIALINKLFHR